MSSYGNKVKALRESLGMSQRAAAKKIGVTAATISNWENGITDPANIKRDTLDKTVAIFGTTHEYLLKGSGEPPALTRVGEPIREQFEEDDFDPETEIRLPVYDIEVSGGPGAQNPEYVDTRETLTFRRSWLKRKRIRAEDLRVVTVRGSSMEPILWDGDKIAVDESKKRIRDGRVFAILYNGEARVKRLHLLVDGRLRISSDNVDKARFPDEFVQGADLELVAIIGQAVHRMGDGGL